VALKAPLVLPPKHHVSLPMAQSCSEGLGPPGQPSVPPACGRNLSEEESALSELNAVMLRSQGGLQTIWDQVWHIGHSLYVQPGPYMGSTPILITGLGMDAAVLNRQQKMVET